VSAVCLSPDGRRVVSGSQDSVLGTLRIWDSMTGKCLHIGNHIHRVDKVMMTLDGTQIVAEDGEQVGLWDLETGQRHDLYDKKISKVKPEWVESLKPSYFLETEGYFLTWRERGTGSVLARYPGEFVSDCSSDGRVAIGFNGNGEAHFFRLHRPLR